MKIRIITLALVLMSTWSWSQTNGGELSGRTVSGTRKAVGVDSTAPNRAALRVKDSTLIATLSAKDSTTMSRKAVVVTNTVAVSGTVTSTSDSTTGSRKGVVLLANPTIANTSFAVTNAGTFAVQVDSSTQRGTVQVSNTVPVTGTFWQATQPVSGTFWQATQPVSGTVTATVDSTSASRKGVVLLANPTIANTSFAVTNAGTFAVQVDEFTASSLPLPTGAATAAKQPALGTAGTASSDVITVQGISGMTALKVDGSGVTQPTSFTRLKASTDTVAISGSITATAGATAIYDSARTVVALDTAGLAAKANSATVGWQSDTVGLRQHKVTDMKLGVKISFANTAPANDKALYIYACPWWYDGTTWYAGSQGTTTLPTGANGTTTIASPNDLRLLGVLSYTTQNQVCQSQFMLSNVFGNTLPDAVSFIVINYTGAAIHTSGNLLYYSLTQRTQR